MITAFLKKKTTEVYGTARSLQCWQPQNHTHRRQAYKDQLCAQPVMWTIIDVEVNDLISHVCIERSHSLYCYPITLTKKKWLLENIHKFLST